MINFTTFLTTAGSLAKGTVALALVATFGLASIASAQSASNVPSCNIFAVPVAITSAQSATLKWVSTSGATFASLNDGTANGIGNIGNTSIGNIAPDGTLVVSPNVTTTYTMHTWNNQGAGSYCSTTVRVDGNGVITAGGGVTNGQPQVTLQTLAIRPASSQVTLGNVPYTGAAENILYTLFLLSLLLTAGYVFKTQRGTVFA